MRCWLRSRQLGRLRPGLTATEQAGRVVEARDFGGPWGRVVVIEHVFYENHRRRSLRSLYAHLDSIAVEAGQPIARRQPIGTLGRAPQDRTRAHLHLELRRDPNLPATFWPASHDLAWIRQRYAPPSEFIRTHRTLFVPRAEPRLALVHQASQRMRLYERGRMIERIEVAFGQAAGRKRRRGDLRTPLGRYHVVARSRGPFGGRYAEFYGGHWIKLNYPNPHDAAWGRRQGLISAGQATAIERAFAQRKATPGDTRLGGGIGFHGWAGEWDQADRRLSWGCLVLHNRDIARRYDWFQPGTTVVLF